MSVSLGQLLGQANRTTVEHRFEFATLPEGWAAVASLAALLLLCWAIVWMYRREGRRGASTTVRTSLAAVRCLVIVSLAAVWLQPVLATYLHKWIDSYCIVLVDDSSSMDLGDQYRVEQEAAHIKTALGDETTLPIRRADVVGRLLGRDNDQFLSGLTRRNRVKLYTFSDAPQLMATLRSASEGEEEGTEEEGTKARRHEGTKGEEKSAGGWPIASAVGDSNSLPTTFAAQGPATNVSRAVRRSVEALSGAPLAGVVLFSDGGFNQGDPMDVLARFVQEKGVAVHAVGVGDASPPQNVRVVEVTGPQNAFKEDPYAITAHITAEGMAGEAIVVELYERDEAGTAAAPVETQTVTVEGDGPLDPVVFNRRRETVGRAIYRVAVPIGPYESVTDDNGKQTVVNIIDDKMRVLLIAGSPSWEYRFLSRLLTRDETFDVSCWLQSAATNAVRDGNTIIDHLPATPEELFAYDAVLLLDPDPAEFGPGWARSVETLVSDYGGGVLYQASRKNTPRFMRDAAVEKIVKILPVTLDPEADLILNKIGHYQTRFWPIEIPQNAAGHPILKLPEEGTKAQRHEGTEEGSRVAWAALPGVFWHYPVLREKPVATVLMRHSDPQMRNSYGGHVLAATQFVGSGRTAFVGFDSTWRWRRNGEEVFNAYWVQMLRYLVEGKLLGAKKRATILTDGTTFQLGGAINVTARLYDTRFEPLLADTVTAHYRIGSVREDLTLQRSPDQPGWFEGRFTPNRTGNYEITLTLPATAASPPVDVAHQIEVARPNIEILHPQMNREALQTLAEQSPGGKYYDVDEIGGIPSAIPDRSESMTVKSRPLQLWDNQWTLILLIGLLTIEWGVRKWVRLL